MLIPHIKFIEALVASKMSITGIKEKLDAYDLPFPEEAILIIINTLKSENPDYFDESKRMPADPDWIRELDITEMFCHFTGFSFPEKLDSIDGAFKLLNDPLMYRLITSMALCLITDEDIELIINGKFNMEYSAEDVKLFLKYFFNVQDWTLRDRQMFVATITEPQLLKYYKIALKGDKEHLLWKLGVTPDKDFKDMLADMVHDSYYNFKEQSKIRPELAQKWAGLTIKLTERIDTLQKEESKGASLLEEIEFKIKTFSSQDPKGPIRNIKDLQPDAKKTED